MVECLRSEDKPAELSAVSPSHLTATLSAAWKLEPKEGMARLRTQIEWLGRTHPKAAASLREGLEETFTINPCCPETHLALRVLVYPLSWYSLPSCIPLR